jgi:hypothetical protein
VIKMYDITVRSYDKCAKDSDPWVITSYKGSIAPNLNKAARLCIGILVQSPCTAGLSGYNFKAAGCLRRCWILSTFFLVFMCYWGGGGLGKGHL